MLIRKKNLVEKILEGGIYLWVFLLPWQTRLIIKQGFLNGGTWEYGTLSLYGTDILLFILLILRIFLGGKRQKFSFFPKQSQNLWPFILGFLAISFLSVYWAFDAGLALYGFIKLAEGIILYWIITTSDLKLVKINTAFGVTAILQSLIGIFQFLFQKTISSKWFGLAFQDPSSAGTSVVESSSNRFLRAYGSFPHPNILAGFLLIGILVLVGLYFQSRRKRERNFILGSAVLVSTGLFFTFSRASWLVLLVVILFLLGLVYLTKKYQEWRFPLIKFLGIIFLVFLVFSLLYPEIIQTRFSSTPRLEQKSIEQRLNYNEQAFDLIKEHWLNGVGINNYTKAVHNEIKPTLSSLEYQPVHNVYLLIFAELGILGLILFLILIGMILKTIWQVFCRHHLANNGWFLIHSTVLIAIFILFLFDHYFWTLSVGIILFWLNLGLWKRALEES